MTAAAIAAVPDLAVSDVEVGREGPSFAFRTLELLADEHPGSQLTFVMGADVASGLDRWKRPERVLELASRRRRRAARLRPRRDRLDAGAASAPAARLERIEMPPVGISSTLVRERVAAGLPIRWMVPEPVERLIADGGLYGAGS